MKSRNLIMFFSLVVMSLSLGNGTAHAIDYGSGLTKPSFFKYFVPLITENNQRDFIGEWMENPIPTGTSTTRCPSRIKISLDKEQNILIFTGEPQPSYAAQNIEIGGRKTLRGKLSDGTNYILSLDGTYGLVFDIYVQGEWHRKFYNQNLVTMELLQELLDAKVIDRYSIEPYYRPGSSLPTDILSIFMGAQRREVQTTSETVPLLFAYRIMGTSY